MSYQLVEKGLITATGLPQGICLKKPSAYGMQHLKLIIKEQAAIKFHGKYLIFIQLNKVKVTSPMKINAT